MGIERSGWLNKVQAALFAEKSVLSQAVLRISFGCFSMWQAYDKGIKVFSGPKAEGFNFTYPGFDWVQTFPAFAQELTVLWFVSGLLLALGFMHRISSVLCFAMTAYAFLLRAEFYLNHEYMELCFLFLLTLGPSNRRLSVDSYIWKYKETAPYFHLFAFKLQTEIILIYAGLVKLNSDWLHLQPLSNWLNNASRKVFFGDIWQHEWGVAAGAYGIILLHLVGAPLLFWKRTRLAVFLAYATFHVINAQIFPIDIFPWMTIACSTLFFDPDWPARLVRKLPFVSGRLNAGGIVAEPQNPVPAGATFGRTGLIAFLCFWLVMQIAIPLRHYLYPGWVEWNVEGTRFSWRMMLSSGVCPAWFVVVNDPDRREIYVSDVPFILRSTSLLKDRICDDPDLILQAVHKVRDYYVKEAGMPPDSEVRAYVMKALNYRTPALLVDPTFNLAKQPRQIFSHYSWLLPGNDLGELPPPFMSHWRDFKPPDLVTVTTAMGFDLLGDYDCKYQRPPKRDDGNDLYCVKRLSLL